MTLYTIIAAVCLVGHMRLMCPSINMSWEHRPAAADKTAMFSMHNKTLRLNVMHDKMTSHACLQRRQRKKGKWQAQPTFCLP